MDTLTRARLAEALFVSGLEPAAAPTPAMVRAAITEMIDRYGVDGCAARMASRFGAEPDLAARRMIWVHRILTTADLG